MEGPAKNELSRAIILCSHRLKPMVDKRGLPDPRPGNDGNDIDMWGCPHLVKDSDIYLSAKNIASCNGQSSVAREKYIVKVDRKPYNEECQ